MIGSHPEEPVEAPDVGNGSVGLPSGSAALPPALVEASLSRVTASTTFRRSARHRLFLRHIVDATLAGQHDRLKEVVIGIEVFGKSIDRYDPRRDPIVRVEAGRIRGKLARFYESEGAGEAFEIRIPTGSYRLDLVRRHASTEVVHPLRSLAVLPFVHLSNDPEDPAFCRGVADLLIDLVGRIPALKVVARLSAFRASERDLDLRGIGRLLDVAHVVEGSLQRNGRRMRCFVHLVDVKDGVRRWSQRFDHDLEVDGDLFALQDRIGEALVAEIDAIAGERRNTPRPPPPLDRHARDLVQHARGLAQQRTIEGYRKAIGMLEQATIQAPDDPRAHSLLAIARGNSAGFAEGAIGPLIAQARAAAERALALDPADGEARAVLAALAHRFDHDWPTAEAMYLEALRQTPNSAFVHTSFAWGLAYHGRATEAIDHAQNAHELDPLDLGTRVNRAFVHACVRRFDVAIDEFEAILAVEPGHLMSQVQRGLALLWSGRAAEALVDFDAATAQVPGHPIVRLVRLAALARSGRVDEAAAGHAVFVGETDGASRAPFQQAMVLACLDRPAECVKALDLAARQRDFSYVSLPSVPLFDALHGRPDFRALCTRTGLQVWSIASLASRDAEARG